MKGESVVSFVKIVMKGHGTINIVLIISKHVTGTKNWNNKTTQGDMQIKYLSRACVGSHILWTTGGQFQMLLDFWKTKYQWLSD